jgi:hypothetical protein
MNSVKQVYVTKKRNIDLICNFHESNTDLIYNFISIKHEVSHKIVTVFFCVALINH